MKVLLKGWIKPLVGVLIILLAGMSFVACKPDGTEKPSEQTTDFTDKIIVSYHANDSYGVMENSKHTYNKESQLTAIAFTRPDAQFAGWNTEIDGSGTAFSDKQNIASILIALDMSNSGLIILYAQWATEGLNFSGNAVSKGTFNGMSVVIPGAYNGVRITAIAKNGFANSPNLTSIKIPENITSIGEAAFENCGNLETVELPSGIKEIRGFTFSGSEKLKNITLPDSLTDIKSYAFYACGLTDLTIPAKVTEIGYSAFERCFDLKYVKVMRAESIPTSDSYGLPDGVLFFVPESALSAYKTANNWDNYADSIYAIESMVPGDFYTVNGLLVRYLGNGGKVVVPSGITTIGYRAFWDTKGMQDIGNPNAVTGVELPLGTVKIEHEAFLFCQSLTEITISASVTEIEYDAFGGCMQLTDMYVRRTAAQGITAFQGFGYSYNAPQALNVYVPDEASAAAYRAASGWTEVASISVRNP